MPVSINEAKKAIGLLEKIEGNNDTDILLRDFPFSENNRVFLYQLSINGKRLDEYITYKLGELPQFKGCVLDFAIPELRVSVPGLIYGDPLSRINKNDLLLIVDLNKKTFEIDTYAYRMYEKLQNEECKPNRFEINEFYKKFEDFTFKKRCREALKALGNKRYALQDFVFLMFVPRKKVETAYKREKTRIDSLNDSELKHAFEANKKRSFYKENAPVHIKMLSEKQNELSTYFKSLGYRRIKD